MSHLVCHKCGSKEHTGGYGFAGGCYGQYFFCDDCSTLLYLKPDIEGITDELAEQMISYSIKRLIKAGVRKVKAEEMVKGKEEITS